MPPSSSKWGQRSTNRWLQLFAGVACMVMIANLQYGWTLFVLPIQQKWGWTKAEIQVAFTIFILLETWLVPFEGWIVDRIGPRSMVLRQAQNGVAVRMACLKLVLEARRADGSTRRES